MFEYNKFQVNSLTCDGCLRPVKEHSITPGKEQLVFCNYGTIPIVTIRLTNGKLAMVQYNPVIGYYYQKMKPFSNIGNLLAHIKTPHKYKETR